MAYVQSFEEGSAEQKELLGGKGANLAEMTSLGLPVPPGFTVTTEACRDFLRHGELPEGLMDEVMDHLDRLEQEMGRELGDPEDPLLVSVRSGAAVSMPGMMDTVLNLGLNDDAVEGLAQETDHRFARDAYRRFVEMFGEIVLGIDKRRFADVREEVLADREVDDAALLDAEALAELLERERAVVEEETGEPLPQDPLAQLRRAIEAVLRSWDNPRARRYRDMEGIADDLGTAVNVQAMVFGNLGDDSATGVAFSRDPATGRPEPSGDWLRNAQGEDVVAGIRVTEDLADMAGELPEVHSELVEVLERLENHYRDVQDVEFTVEREKLWILQTRTGKRSAQATVRIATDMVEEGVIDEQEALLRVDPVVLERLLHPQFDPDATYELLTSGLAASPGAASGEVCFTADEAEERAGRGVPVILVRPETSPDDVHGLAASEGVLTSRGGMVSHAAIVARSIGKPAVCGARKVEIDLAQRRFRVGDVTVEDGDVISLDGATGEVVAGEVDLIEPQPDERFHRLLEWADRHRRLGIRANADTAEDASTAVEFGAEGVGLCRTEHMFLGERTPLIRRFILAADEEERRDALDELETAQQKDFVALLQALEGRPLTVRLLDAPLHEFLPDTDELIAAEATDELDDEGRSLLDAVRTWRERNPMLGTRAIRLAVLYPELYRMQVRAIVGAIQDGDSGEAEVQIMIPLVAIPQEMSAAVEWVRDAIEETGGDPDGFAIGTMIETPAAALTAAELAEDAAFFSFGTNDLTQLTLGFSRDDVAARILEPYLDQGLLSHDPFQSVLEPSVGRLIRLAVDEGRGRNSALELGICGEHGGDPDSIRFFADVDLDYVSVSAYRVPAARLAAAHAQLEHRD
ncbi:MAG: pyruvate, phosphate dikinase [Nitriliruptorales bacterium]|nr:pyruvate, phosphate dikinase [Nitriliruptorales bacterium]